MCCYNGYLLAELLRKTYDQTGEAQITEHLTRKTTMEQSWEDVLESYRFELTRVLRPDRYFDKFRSDRILDERDAEEIKNETIHPTRDKKAGVFLDIVVKKGKAAYDLLLECVEADHPDLFKKITGKDPFPQIWTTNLSKTCSCECHDDRISLDLIEAYKKEKKQNISLKQEITKLTKSVDKGREERLKLKHLNEAQSKQIDVLHSETGDIQKLKDDIQWKQLQICDLQAKAYESQTQLIATNDKLRKVNLENNALQNRIREAQAKLSLQRKKSTRLEQERSTDRMKVSDTLRALVDQLHELGLDRSKKTEDSYKPPADDLHEQTTLEILMSDKQEAMMKCEEAVNELVAVRKQLYDVQDSKTKLQAENEELDTINTLLTEERDMVMERLAMAQEELTQVSAERSQAISQRNRSFEETARSMLERDDLVKKLNQERQSYLKQTRTIFEYKTKVHRLKREKKLLLQDRPPSLASSSSMDGSNDSKRSSGAHDVSDIEAGTSAGPLNGTTKSTRTSDGSPSNQLEAKRSISIGEIKQSSFDISGEDDDLADYEYPIARKRSQQVTEVPAALRGRRTSNASKSDHTTGLDSHRSSCRSEGNDFNDSGSVSGTDQGDEGDENGVLNSLPSDVDDRVTKLWSEFDYSAPEEPSKERRVMRSGGVSTEVNPGSLKDKKRTPGPRLSSYEIPPSNYMADVKRDHDRRSKTLGCDPDNPDDLSIQEQS